MKCEAWRSALRGSKTSNLAISRLETTRSLCTFRRLRQTAGNPRRPAITPLSAVRHLSGGRRSTVNGRITICSASVSQTSGERHSSEEPKASCAGHGTRRSRCQTSHSPLRSRRKFCPRCRIGWREPCSVRSGWSSISMTARATVEESFSLSATIPKIAEILQSAAALGPRQPRERKKRG